jgi:hypothetical protein
MPPQLFLQLFGGDFAPLNGVALGIQERGRMIVPVDFSERFVAIHALLSLIPLVDDRPYEAGLGSFLDLRQTLLGAVFPFWPTRALTQLQLLFMNRCL